MSRLPDPRGSSIVELMAVLALTALLALVTAPDLKSILRTSRFRAATRHLAMELDGIRSRAIGTGWQYRLVGLNGGASDGHRNQYRIMGRQSAGVAWPTLGAAPSASSTLIVGEWVDLEALYPGVVINPADNGEFALAFGPRGAPVEVSLSFNPLALESETGARRFLTVSPVGTVRIE